MSTILPQKLSRGEKRVIQSKIIELLLNDIKTLESFGPDDPEVLDLIAKVKELNPSVDNTEKLVSYALTIVGDHVELDKALRSLLSKIQMSKRSDWDATASHHQKRAFVASLGLNRQSFSLQTLAESASLQAKLGIKVVIRKRNFDSMMPLRSTLSDRELIKKEGWVRLAADESAIYVDIKENNDGTVEYYPLLTVLRRVGSTGQQSEAVFNWGSDVVLQACRERKNVRPNHDGKIVQLGWNAGARHARVFGLAKSYTKNLDSSEMADHDNDAISLLTLCWSQAKAHMPTEIMNAIENSLKESKLPRLATRNVPEGLGYQLEIEGKTYNFPFFERAPPEGYFSQDYVATVHKDRCYAEYGLSWCIGRVVDENSQNPGGSFVDVSLRVVVEQATGTLMAFQPEYPHGTSELAGAHNRICAITFSAHILKSYEKAIAAGGSTIESGAGAGTGDGENNTLS